MKEKSGKKYININVIYYIMIFELEEGVKVFTRVSLKNDKTPKNETQKPTKTIKAIK